MKKILVLLLSCLLTIGVHAQLKPRVVILTDIGRSARSLGHKGRFACKEQQIHVASLPQNNNKNGIKFIPLTQEGISK